MLCCNGSIRHESLPCSREIEPFGCSSQSGHHRRPNNRGIRCLSEPDFDNAWMAQLVRAQVSYLSLITHGVSNPEVVSSILTPSIFFPPSQAILQTLMHSILECTCFTNSLRYPQCNAKDCGWITTTLCDKDCTLVYGGSHSFLGGNFCDNLIRRL